jgi:signal transduction histidine kinase
MDRLWVRITVAIVVLFGLMMLITETGADILHEVRSSSADDDDLCEEEGPVSKTVLVASVFFALISGVYISRMLSAPVSTLAETAQIIGRGDLNARVAVKGSREIRAVAAAFNQMTADLQHSMELRDTLMADVSHELRTPLTVLAGNLSAALDHVYDLDEAEIANLYGQTHHLIQLVNDLHELARAAARQLPLDRQPTDMGPLLLEVFQTFEGLATEHNLTLDRRIEPDLPLIMVDASRIRQVFHNLLSNALRYTPNGGIIRLEASAHENEMLLVISDTGKGIDPKHIANVFDRFYRADPSRSRTTGGTGLGLAIVKAIVEAHGGRVTVYSAGLDKGTTFKVWLPSD